VKTGNPRILASLGFAALCSWAQSTPAVAQFAPPLGTAGDYAVLGTNAIPTTGTVSCTTSTINGDVGTTGASITNTSCTINGAVVAPVPAQAVADFDTAYAQAENLNPVCTDTIPTVTSNLGPGVYCSPAGVTLGAGVIFTLTGDADDVWVFRVGTGGLGALTGNSFQVVMGGTANPCNVYWRTAEAATMTDSAFIGTILSGTAVTLTGGTFTGRALARTDVAITDVVPVNGCAGITGSPTAIPTVSQYGLGALVAMMALLGVVAIRRLFA
jgi:hypothetical protein